MKNIFNPDPKKKQAQEVLFSTKFHSPNHPEFYNLTIQYICNWESTSPKAFTTETIWKTGF